MQQDVLALLHRHLPESGFRTSGSGNVIGRCPFHKGGQERKPSFSVSLTKGVFHCFTCQEAGSLWSLLEKLRVPPSAIRTELAIIKPQLDTQRENVRIERENAFSNRDPFITKSELPEAILGVYDYVPEHLVHAGFSPQVLHEQEVGFDQSQDRVTYPLRDMYGTLAGISGGSRQKWVQPKYKVYQGGRRDPFTNRWIPGDFGQWFDDEYPGYQCENHDFLWNYHRVWGHLAEMSDPAATLILTEGFKACMWLLQHGYWYSVALMGTSLSERQQQQIHRLGVRVLLCLDNDYYGRRGMLFAGDKLWGPMRGRIDVVNYPLIDDDSQPDDYHGDLLHHLIHTKLPFDQYVTQEARRGET